MPPRITPAMCAWGRTIAEPRLSPDGSLVAFCSTFAGRGQLVVVDAAGGPERVVTSEPSARPSAAYGGGVFDWLPDGSGLVYVSADGGLWLVPTEGGPSRQIVPAGSVAAPAVSPDGSRVAYTVDGGAVAIASLDPDGPWPTRLSRGADFCFDPAWSPDGSRVVWQEWDVPHMPWDESRIVGRDVRDVHACEPPRIVFQRAGVQCQQPRFSPDGRLAGLCDADGWLNIWALGDSCPLVREPHEHGGPTWGPGQRSFAFSPDGCRVAFQRNEGGFGRLVVAEVATGETTDVAKGVHAALSWSAGRLAAIRSGARTPTQVVVYDTVTWERVVVARGPLGGFEAADLVEPELVSWPSDDGAEVHGRLYRPRDSATGPGRRPPMIVWVHGGPTDQWPVNFNARLAYWVDQGWAVLVPDHRGSTGHGRAYTQAMRHGWGDLDVRDVAAGMRAAGGRDWCDPDRMVPMGGSAGGFTVLHLMARHPELCAAGVDLYGVADLLDLDETTHRFEKHYLHSIVGPLPEAAARYRDHSPVNHVDRITSPLLILQGDADVVVPPAQSRAIADRLRALGRVVEYHEYPGEGHGWSRPETIIDEFTRIGDFLRRHVVRWRP